MFLCCIVLWHISMFLYCCMPFFNCLDHVVQCVTFFIGCMNKKIVHFASDAYKIMREKVYDKKNL